ncbi:hypothetical protein [Sphingomonas elodea]|uniref:hypothetical protein n=1 Tax=Sphingomonas elodea TaxID=179878 RepID=UPI0002630A4C|nr:hypothetical protein [Sphingomonas elodea]
MTDKRAVHAYFRSVALFFLIVLSAPFMFGVVGAWDESTLFALFLFGIPFAFLITLSGTMFWLFRGIRNARDAGSLLQRTMLVLAAPSMLVATLLLSLPLLSFGGVVGTLSRLALNQSRYERIIAKARKHGPGEWRGEEDGVSFTTDPGPPLRVAFNPAGFLNNWAGIIYDPTGDVMLAKGFDAKGRFAAPERVTKLFGGDLVGCRHLWGAYYSCSFT